MKGGNAARFGLEQAVLALQPQICSSLRQGALAATWQVNSAAAAAGESNTSKNSRGNARSRTASAAAAGGVGVGGGGWGWVVPCCEAAVHCRTPVARHLLQQCMMCLRSLLSSLTVSKQCSQCTQCTQATITQCICSLSPGGGGGEYEWGRVAGFVGCGWGWAVFA